MAENDVPTGPDPEIAAIMAEMAAAGLPDITTLPVAQARAQVEATNRPWNEPPEPVAVVEDLEMAGPGGPIRCRLFRPDVAAPQPAIVYCHGGGFVVCSLATHDRLMRLLAKATGAAVLGVDYRLAPEHPFPAALDDCVAAARWLHREAGGLGLDPVRMVLAGDSAGANLALASLLELRAAGEPLPRGAALFYGCYWSRVDTAAHARCGDGRYQLSSAQMVWFWRHYLGTTPPGDPRAEPLYAELGGLPPLFLSAAGCDPLLDDTLELARRLAAAGVPHELKVHQGLIHAFMRLTPRSAAAREAFTQAAAAIRGMLAVG